MPRIKLKQVDGIGRKNVSDAFTAFMHHCQLKNLSPYYSISLKQRMTSRSA